MIDDIIVDSVRQLDLSDLRFPIIVLYDRPSDYPNCFVARVHDVDRPTNTVVLSDNVTKLMKDLYDAGMQFIPPSGRDPGHIIGSFV